MPTIHPTSALPGPAQYPAILLLIFAACISTTAAVRFASPGFAPSEMDDQGRLAEDWGLLQIALSESGAGANTKPSVTSILLDGVIPAAQARSQHGPLALTLTAFRSPIWPAGVDVLTADIEETGGAPARARLALRLPDNVRVGARTVALGARTVVALPAGTRASQATREWGWSDDAVSNPRWARPAADCDPAFQNIRAGMGGVPILYAFKIEPKSSLTVVLGFCESHWAQSGQRPMVCRVEGAPPQEVDPIARWGQHRPGALVFPARDANGDGKLDVAVLPQLGAPDQNPILNVIWLFPPTASLNLDQVIAGRLNGVAIRRVDAGGKEDQCLYAGGTVDYSVALPARGKATFTFLVACQGASAPLPDQSEWTLEKLRAAARGVWQDWREP